jgi:hypothetical protein
MFLAGCYEPASPQDVIGTYRSNHKHGEEILQVKHDGTYSLTYILDGKIVLKNQNTWDFESKEGKPAISFREYIFGYRNPALHHDNHPGWWLVEVERRWDGRLELNTDPDLYYYFIKDREK